MDIYLAGTPLRQLFTEVSCGDSHFGGVKVDMPPDRYEGFIGRIGAFHAERYENHSVVDTFLAHRCGKAFLQRFLERYRTSLASSM